MLEVGLALGEVWIAACRRLLLLTSGGGEDDGTVSTPEEHVAAQPVHRARTDLVLERARVVLHRDHLGLGAMAAVVGDGEVMVRGDERLDEVGLDVAVAGVELGEEQVDLVATGEQELVLGAPAALSEVLMDPSRSEEHTSELQSH